jgi:hypothetical protein
MKTTRTLAVIAGLAGALGATVGSVHAQSCAPYTYTSDADFDQGVLFNVNHDAPNNDQLQLNVVISGFPNLWIANAGEDTVSKIDANTGKEVARYRTWFGPSGQPGYENHWDNPWAGAAPSRTAVDGSGNVYSLNRHFDGRPAVLIKILTTGGIDRNGNSVIDTSTDSNNDGTISGSEILPMGDSNNNGIIDPGEIQDERVAWAVRVGPNNGLGRSCSIDPDGNIWVGLYNNAQYYKVSGANGVILAGPINVGHNPYGSLVDGNGILWGASLGNSLLKLDTHPPYSSSLYYHDGANYGIAIGNGKVYLANYGLGSFTQFDPATSTFSYPAAGSVTSYGIGVDGAGNIFVSDDVGGSGFSGASKFRPDGSVIWSTPAQAGATGGDQRGAIVDSNGDVWIINRPDHRISKYRGSDGAPLGVFPVGNQPYTYSDASGQSFLSSNPSGTWTVVRDGGAAGQGWGTIAWNASVPSGTSLAVQARAADTIGGLAAKTFQSVGNGIGFCTAGMVGRYIEIQATLAATGATSPILYDLTVTPCDNFPPVTDCSFVQSAAHRITTLTVVDNCDPNPKVYVKDSASGFVAGPFTSGNKVLIRKNPNQAPFSRSGPAPYKATIQLKGDPQVYGVDANGNQSVPSACHLPTSS